jgi:hypothetical protein
VPRQFVGLLAVASVVAGFLAGSSFGGKLSDMWAWQSGDSNANIGRLDGSKDLSLNAADTLNATAAHVRIVGRDGNFEFEHGAGVAASRLNSYYAGTATRTPIAIGGGAEGQDLVALIVQGLLGQKHDLQQWQAPAGKTVAAIDGRGGLRLGAVTLTTAIRQGHAVLLAILPSGKTEVLATGG